MIPLYNSRTGRAFNAMVVRTQVVLAEWLLGMRDPIRLVTLPTAWDAVRDLRRRALVVNKVDKYSTHPEVDQTSVAKAEQELLKAADLVLFVNRELMEEDVPVAGDRAIFFDHGVDIDHFQRCPPDQIPPDLVAIPQPRIGYFGSLDDYRSTWPSSSVWPVRSPTPRWC